MRVLRVLRDFALCVVLGVACNGATDLGLEVTVPKNLVSKTSWFEVGAFKDVRCGALYPMLDNGIPDGYASRVAFEKKDSVGPRFGEIDPGHYAFAAVARDKECAVIAKGCIEDDADKATKVTIALKGVEDPVGKCGIGASCRAAKCVPANDNADPTVGAGCSLELVGAGPLLHMAQGSTSLMSAPAIAPTSTGFVISYRQNDPGGGEARLIILPIDTTGGVYGNDLRDSKLNNKPALAIDGCTRGDETDGLALIAAGNEGIITVANNCDGTPSLTALTFTIEDQNKKLVAAPSGALTFPVPGAPPFTLGSARAAAVRQNGSLLVYTQGGTARIAGLDKINGIRGYTAPQASFGGTAGITDAWIAANDNVLALLAAGTGAVPRTPVDDAGDEGGDEGEPNKPTMRLLILPPDTAPETINAVEGKPIEPFTFPGKWGSIAALGGRVIVMTDGEGPGRVVYRAFDLGTPDAKDTAGFTVQGEGDVTAGDVTIVGSRAYFAALKPQSIELHVYGNAGTTLTPLSKTSLGREPRISAISTIGDGRVAIAATPSRVAVAWTTQKKLDENDPAGGYAVFACTE